MKNNTGTMYIHWHTVGTFNEQKAVKYCTTFKNAVLATGNEKEE